MSARDAALCIEIASRNPLALEILEKQQYREKIPLMLPPDLKIAHKTGELEGVRHDAGLIDGRIVLAMLTRDGQEPWEVDLALARIAKAVYEGASTA
jgi:beta-lactamase class A